MVNFTSVSVASKVTGAVSDQLILMLAKVGLTETEFINMPDKDEFATKLLKVAIDGL